IPEAGTYGSWDLPTGVREQGRPSPRDSMHGYREPTARRGVLDAAVLLLLGQHEERGVRPRLRVGVRNRRRRCPLTRRLGAVAEDDLPRDELSGDRRLQRELDRERMRAARLARRDTENRRRAAADRDLRHRVDERVLPRLDRELRLEDTRLLVGVVQDLRR